MTLLQVCDIFSLIKLKEREVILMRVVKMDSVKEYSMMTSVYAL